MESLPIEDQDTKILDHLPTAIGKAAIDVCLSSMPLALATVNLVGVLGGKYISLRNEKKIAELLQSLKYRIEVLESQELFTKESLSKNSAYQEVAHKRLLAISALDSEQDLNLSANLVAICSLLSDDDPQDKYLLSALGDITPGEVRLFILGDKKRRKIEKLKSQFTDLQRRDAQSDVEVRREVSIEFFNDGQKLLGLYNFTHLLSRLHSFGLIESPNMGGYSDYNNTPKVYPPTLTPLGEYFLDRLNQVSAMNL